MDDDDLTLQKQLQTDIQRTRRDFQKFLDNILVVMAGFRYQKLISHEEHDHVLYRYRHFMSAVTVIEMIFIASPSECALWCAQQLVELGDELAKYIDELECFNDTEIFRRLEIQEPGIKLTWTPPKR